MCSDFLQIIRNNDEKVLSSIRVREDSRSFAEKNIIHASVYYEHHRCEESVQEEHRKSAEQIFKKARECHRCRSWDQDQACLLRCSRTSEKHAIIADSQENQRSHKTRFRHSQDSKVLKQFEYIEQFMNIQNDSLSTYAKRRCDHFNSQEQK